MQRLFVGFFKRFKRYTVLMLSVVFYTHSHATAIHNQQVALSNMSTFDRHFNRPINQLVQLQLQKKNLANPSSARSPLLAYSPAAYESEFVIPQSRANRHNPIGTLKSTSTSTRSNQIVVQQFKDAGFNFESSGYAQLKPIQEIVVGAVIADQTPAITNRTAKQNVPVYDFFNPQINPNAAQVKTAKQQTQTKQHTAIAESKPNDTAITTNTVNTANSITNTTPAQPSDNVQQADLALSKTVATLDTTTQNTVQDIPSSTQTPQISATTPQITQSVVAQPPVRSAVASPKTLATASATVTAKQTSNQALQNDLQASTAVAIPRSVAVSEIILEALPDVDPALYNRAGNRDDTILPLVIKNPVTGEIEFVQLTK